MAINQEGLMNYVKKLKASGKYDDSAKKKVANLLKSQSSASTPTKTTPSKSTSTSSNSSGNISKNVSNKSVEKLKEARSKDTYNKDIGKDTSTVLVQDLSNGREQMYRDMIAQTEYLKRT